MKRDETPYDRYRREEAERTKQLEEQVRAAEEVQHGRSNGNGSVRMAS